MQDTRCGVLAPYRFIVRVYYSPRWNLKLAHPIQLFTVKNNIYLYRYLNHVNPSSFRGAINNLGIVVTAHVACFQQG